MQVVLQGGLGVARHLHEAVKSGTTSVIVYGSGGVCDVLVDLIRHHDSLVGQEFGIGSQHQILTINFNLNLIDKCSSITSYFSSVTRGRIIYHNVK